VHNLLQQTLHNFIIIVIMVDEDDFKGTGSPMRNSPESSSSSLSSVAPQNLKTTGLQESDYKNCQRHKLSVEEDGVKAMMQYLPQSAALLVTALQRSGVIRNKFKKSVDDFYYHEEADDEEAAIPYAEISHAMTSKDGEIVENPPRPSPPLPITLLTTPQMEINERVADMLLESIIRMDDDFGGCSIQFNTRKKTESVARKARRGGLGVGEGSDVVAVANDVRDIGVAERTHAMAMAMAATGSGVAATISYDDNDHDDDDDSIRGDMSLLETSIARLQRDLENVDLSHLELDDFYDDDDAYDGDASGDDTSLLSRLKRWFSRGMIMEQKLLHTYLSNNLGNTDYYDDGATYAAVATMANDMGASRGRGGGGYTDNPVLAWSLALMWAFVVLILMCPKIEQLVEGGGWFDDKDLSAQLPADIIDWMFG
jgi:hypothetical protein